MKSNIYLKMLLNLFVIMVLLATGIFAQDGAWISHTPPAPTVF
jgi:hypothetical protein